MRGEERERPVEEPDRRRRCLVFERFDVGEAGEPIDRRVEVRVADSPALPSLRATGGVAVAAVDLPAAAVGDLPDFLHVDVDHVPGVAGGDRPRLAKVLPAGGEIADPVQAELVQPAGHGPHAAADVVTVGELPGDPTGRPLQLSSPVLDQLHHPSLHAGRAVCGSAGAVLEPRISVVAVAGDPFRQGRASDVELRGDVRDRTASVDHLVDSSLPSEHGQRGITMGHGTGLLPADEWLQHHPACRSGTRSFAPHPADYNVMTRNMGIRF